MASKVERHGVREVRSERPKPFKSVEDFSLPLPQLTDGDGRRGVFSDEPFRVITMNEEASLSPKLSLGSEIDRITDDSSVTFLGGD